MIPPTASPWPFSSARPAPHFWPNTDISHIPEQYRYPPVIRTNYYLLYIFSVFNITQAPNHEFSFSHLQDPAADIVIAAAHCFTNPGNRNVKGSQLIRIQGNLVLLNKAAYRRDLGYPFN